MGLYLVLILIDKILICRGHLLCSLTIFIRESLAGINRMRKHILKLLTMHLEITLPSVCGCLCPLMLNSLVYLMLST